MIPNTVNLQNIGFSSAQVFEVANSAATLINPSQNQVDEALPAPPAFGDRMVIFTDEQTAQQCNTCTPIEIFPANGLEKSIEKLYGPTGNGQINPNQIISYSFRDLAEYIENPFNRTDLEANLSKADWVIFALRELDPTAQTSYALHDLIAKDAVILQDKHIIVFSFDVPFIFDATEIASFSAYYAMYGKTPPFLDVAARVIFQEMNPSGASPVSIPGIAYDLIATLQPDPEQIIALEVDQEAARELIVEDEISVLENGVDSDLPNFELGDLLPVKTGVIVDHNGHPVPDGTIVRFVMNEQGTISNTQQVEAETVDGVARASFLLQKVGVHEINVTSEPAMLSQILVLDITGEEAIVSAIIPTPMPTADPDEVESDIQDGQSAEISANPNSKFSEWILSVVVSWMAGLSAFYLLVNVATTQERVKVAAGSVVSGLLVSLWFAFGLAQDGPIRSGMNGYLRVMLIVLVWALLGGIVSWLFFTRIYPGLSQE